MEKLPIVFRKDRGKEPEIIAVFPTLPQDYQGCFMTCYAHIGQHGGCDFGWYHSTRRANPAEYADLLAELRQIYEQDENEPVELVVYQRIQPAHRKAFKENLRRQNHPGEARC
jgi:hypothetical protein